MILFFAPAARMVHGGYSWLQRVHVGMELFPVRPTEAASPLWMRLFSKMEQAAESVTKSSVPTAACVSRHPPLWLSRTCAPEVRGVMAATPTSISVAPLSAIWRFLARRRLSAQSVFLILFFIRGKETSNSASKFNGRPNFHKTSKQRIKCCCFVVILRSLYVV